eukprot:GILK01004957.1.p1 GENE.GILK01004957.1~~GILK01004957.1.p1  ORF type:complete len:611 (-),score=116.98 GILK01004957.1:162-1811(-)
MAAAQFMSEHEAIVRPLEKTASLAWWNANVTGDEESFAKKEEAENELNAVLSNKTRFDQVRELFNRLDTIRQEEGPIMARQIEVVYRQYLEKQADPSTLQQMVKLSSEVDRIFNNFRVTVGDKQWTDNQVRQILRTSKDEEERRMAWEGSKAVGPLIDPILKQLIGLRNKTAQALGFENYHKLALFVSEQDPDEMTQLFDDLDDLTRGPFTTVKAEMDTHLSSQFGIESTQLRPWHFQDPFFQEAIILGADLDQFYGSQDILDLCVRYYRSIGLPIDDVLSRSDLYEKPGKSPHAFCTDIDREGDVRVLQNIVANERWMETSLHELGHSVYSSKNMPRIVPYTLRCQSHILTTEGIAMLFGRLSKTPSWQKAMGVCANLSAEEERILTESSKKTLSAQLLIFSRWCQVMYRFEASMYANPDQDLNQLWWDLVEKYQGLHRPDNRTESTGRFADYASKIHVVSAPVYYHNYMCGEMFASQLLHTIKTQVCGVAEPTSEAGQDVSLCDNVKIGEFLIEKVFAPANTFSWNELTKFATGQSLQPKAFALDFQ